MPKICLFDASNYIHRAFHAIPPLNNSKGEPVNAIYGFSRMLAKVLKEDKPDFVGVCFDTPKPTFRHDEYKEYKGTRQEIDQALLFQLPLAEEFTKEWGLPCLKKEGFEADDVIATLAHQAEKLGWQVIIFSGDKDTLQLVSKNIFVRDEMKRVEYNLEKVKERFGIESSQLVDYFSLMGDKVDNVIGVPGVGDKTASKLIAQYGNLENLYETMNGSLGNLKEKLIANKENVFKNRRLVLLRDDVPLDMDESVLRLKPPSAAFEQLLNRFEFKGDIFGVQNVLPQKELNFNSNRKVHVVLTEIEFKALLEKLDSTRLISYDLETDGLNKLSCNIVGISLAVHANEGWYIPVGHHYMGMPAQLDFKRVISLLKPFLENPAIKKCAQNMKFDNTILARFGITVQGEMFDSMVAAYCVDPSRNSYGLKDLAADYLSEKMTKIDEIMPKNTSFSEVSIDQAAMYAAADSEVVIRLVDFLQEGLKKENAVNLFSQLEMPLVGVIQLMEQAGIKIDTEHLRHLKKKFSDDSKGLEKEIFELAGEQFTLNSPKQLSRILFEKLQLPVIKKTKTGYSTDEEVLQKLSEKHAICQKIISYRELAKLTSTYVDSLLELVEEKTQRVHTTFHQTGTITGRLSSSNPNLQNIPIKSDKGREIRRSFIAEEGCLLVSADYSQIDLRALAHMSDDPVLVKTFHEGGDIHLATAAEVFGVDKKDVTTEMRRNAKAINFGIVYGQQAYALSQSLGIPMETAKEFIKKYFEKYAGVKTWIEKTLESAREHGFVLTLAGRKRNIPDIKASNAMARGFAERTAMNTPIQGTSADIIKFAMISMEKLMKLKKFKSKMLLQVHDELVFEVPENEMKEILPLIKSEMENAFKLKVPLLVDIKIGKNWNDMEKIKVGA
ncbi:MAG: DNA polymerase I [Elusimicrobiota bacterium]